ncbi:MAG: O-antigen ligase family protein [Hydrogenophaga sp.]
MPVLMSRFQPSLAQKNLLVSSLCVAGGVALVVAYRFAHHGIDTPSQRINWAGGLVMLACVTVPMLRSGFLSKFNQRALIFAAVALVVAVLLTGSRGPYLALPWVVLGSFWFFGRNIRSMLGVKAAGWRLAVSLVAVMIVLPIALPKVFEVPVARVMLGVAEMQAMVTGSTRNSHAIDTSVGTRVYMWRKSEQKIIDSPWIGYGRVQRMAFIQEWGAEVNAAMVTDQTHMHSEYINGMIDHGVFGLLSTLSYMVGAAVLAWRLRKRFSVAAFSVGGIAFTHWVMSFTDTNSQTNNYSVMITVSMLIVFWLASPNTDDPAPRVGIPLPKPSNAQ